VGLQGDGGGGLQGDGKKAKHCTAPGPRRSCVAKNPLDNLQSGRYRWCYRMMTVRKKLMTVTELARLGGLAARKKMTPAQASALGKKGAQTRWANWAKKRAAEKAS
jgi:hypothetical protein